MSFLEKTLVLLLAAAVVAAGVIFVLQGRSKLPVVEGETTVLSKPPENLAPPGEPVDEPLVCRRQNGRCPKGCYSGPSSCSAGKPRFCTRDIICAAPGYDPSAKSRPQRSPVPIP